MLAKIHRGVKKKNSMTKKLKTLTGMHDIFGGEIALWQKLEKVSRQILENAGYAEIRMPLLEDTTLFARGIGQDNQVVAKEMYTFGDRGDDSITLRPEGTASVVRAFVEHGFDKQEEVTKLYYLGPMFRYERPQKGRQRQFHQIGAEVLGVDSPLADAELVILVDRIAKQMGLSGYDVEINSLGTFVERKPYLQNLKNYFEKLAQDFCDDCQRKLKTNLLRIFDCKIESCQKLCQEAPVLLDVLGAESKKDFQIFQEQLKKAGVHFKINARIVRGLDYYEKNTFEFVSNKLGSQSAFAGGGRYNHLVEELGGPATPGVGFSIGCERVVMLMQELPKVAAGRSGVYFAALSEDAVLKSREFLQDLRDQGIKADSFFGVKSLKAQLRRANKLNYKYVVMMGEDELKKNTVVLKNLETGEQKEVAWEFKLFQSLG